MGIQFQYPDTWYIDIEPGILSKRGALVVTSFGPTDYGNQALISLHDAKVTMMWENRGQPTDLFRSIDAELPKKLAAENKNILVPYHYSF
jgi:hypothetical protein